MRTPETNGTLRNGVPPKVRQVKSIEPLVSAIDNFFNTRNCDRVWHIIDTKLLRVPQSLRDARKIDGVCFSGGESDAILFKI